MIMPDHVPTIEGDPGGAQAFAFAFRLYSGIDPTGEQRREKVKGERVKSLRQRVKSGEVLAGTLA